MGTSVKGLLKGLRYISQIFDEKEPEMQIGLPTDVKHVAHIGWDGPSAGGNQNTPSWMNEFKSSPRAQNSSDLVNSIGELDLSSANIPAQESEEQDVQKAGRAPKSKRQTSTESSSLDSSSTRRNSEKGARRQRSSCPPGDATPQEGSSRSSRRRRGSTESGSENPIPKHSNRRKSKGSSDGGESTRSTKSSRSRDHSLTDIPLPALEAVDEERG
ncbi:CRIB domain-containing protein RIC7-like [Momordica charantia]|uniref:CRIB domain-containing protein RIC7-like n=1 Tax=Momordica charantia TaxID=3673 RepID=A0A6J1CYH9_MOMCH|nr:CRIB domain-containing protein RIC7-like [Momordica charantia]